MTKRFVLILLLIGGSPLSAQTAPRAEIPGTYPVKRCVAAPFPAELPPLDSVLDATRLIAALRGAGVANELVLSLRLSALQGAGPRVRVVEKKVSNAVAERASRAVEAALRDVPPDRPWAFRLVIDGEQGPAISLTRSEVCGASPRARHAQVRTAVVTESELDAIRREAERYQQQRRLMLHRVLVDADGRVLAFELVRSSGDGRMDFNESGLFKTDRFGPTRLDGVPVAAWIELGGDDWPRR